MPETGLLRDLLVIFALGVAVVVFMHRFRVPPIVGLLLTGVLCGPYGFGLIRGIHEVEAIAEVGVILLLFTIGLELSLSELARVKRVLVVGGGLQVGVTLAGTAGVALLLGMRTPLALFLGMLVALSSTAIVLRLLTERGELDSPHGRAVLAILIFQDLCVVPMVLAVPYLTGEGGGIGALGVALGKAALFVAGAIVASRVLVPWLLERVVGTGRREVFLLTVILLCLGAAWASAAVGLSLALGAFIAGLVIGESPYSHQALGEVLPLREVFNSVFFVSIGMLLDVRTVLAEPLLVGGALAATILVKASIIAGAALALGLSLRVALVTGLALGQIGEFSFVLSKAGLDAGLLDPRLNQLFLATAVGSMALTPLLVASAPRIAERLEAMLPRRLRSSGRRTLDAPPRPVPTDHVIVVGYGMNGRTLARVLDRHDIPVAVVEIGPDRTRAARMDGRYVVFGDVTHPEVLEHAGIHDARVLVLAMSDAGATRRAANVARRLVPGLHIVARTRYYTELQPLARAGADEVVAEEYESSIEILTRVLRRYFVPRDQVERSVEEIRAAGYEMLRSVPAPAASGEALDRFVQDLSLETVRVAPRSALAGRRLADSGLRERTGATVVAVQRADVPVVLNPSGRQEVEAGDILLMLGTQAQLAVAAVLASTPDGAAPAGNREAPLPPPG